MGCGGRGACGEGVGPGRLRRKTQSKWGADQLNKEKGQSSSNGKRK